MEPEEGLYLYRVLTVEPIGEERDSGGCSAWLALAPAGAWGRMELEQQKWVGVAVGTHHQPRAQAFRPTARVEVPRIDARTHRCFPGSSVLKNLPANAGDRGVVPRSGRSLRCLFVLKRLSSYIGCLQCSFSFVSPQNQRPVDSIQNPDKMQEDEKRLSPRSCWVLCSVEACVRAAVQMARAVYLRGTLTTESFSSSS